MAAPSLAGAGPSAPGEEHVYYGAMDEKPTSIRQLPRLRPHQHPPQP